MIIQKKNVHRHFTLSISWSDCDTFNYKSIPVLKHHLEDGWITGRSMLLKIL
jgi:hypothetical protein